MPQSPFTTGAVAVALAAAAGAAQAQDICGRSGAVWIGGAPEASDISTASSYFEEMALVMGGNEYVAAFRVSEAGPVRVEAAGRGAGDTVLDLLDGAGAFLLSDDDSGGGGASRAETTLEPGDYCLAVRSFDGGPMSAFVRVGRQDHPALTLGVMDTPAEDADGGCESGQDLGGLGTTASGSAEAVPYWRFTLDTPSAVSILAENETADPLITLYDSAGDYLAENDDYSGLNSQIDMTDPLPAGEYCVKVEALSDPTVEIEITLRAYDSAQALLDLYARGEAAPPLDGSIEITDLGMLETRLRTDVQAGTEVVWHMVEIAEPGMILIEAIGTLNSDPWLVLFDDFGREIAQNDDHGAGLDSQIAARVTAGQYLVGVKQFQDGSGIIRLAMERYVRATK